MMLRRHLWALALLPLVACAGQREAPVAAQPSRQSVLDAALRQQVESGKVAGISAVVVRADGEVLYQGAQGPRVPGAAEPIGPDSLFRLASMTKPVTSVAVMTLVEDGRLRLEDPLAKHLPEFRDLRIRETNGRLVPARQPTIRDLLRHMGGFSYNFLNVPGIVEAYAREGVDDGLAAPGRSTRDNMRRLARAPLQAQPGTLWAYSLATDVLGAVVERVSGKPLDAYIQERIAGPLRLTSFAFHVPESERARMVTAMHPVDGALRPIRSGERIPYPLSRGTWVSDPERAFSRTAYPSGGAGATATIGDYARFTRMLLNGGELDGVRILRAETVAAMTRGQTGGLPVNLRGPGYDFGYGFSVVTDPAAAKTRQPAGTYGWGGIYGTGFFIDPVNRLAIIVMTQTATNGGPAANEVREAFYGTMVQ
ncbi:serine hydrolase domain-containing protein [Belnapia rosea]|uniref:CubicO group peptidase, beta-lactamase class C family n=1 Tax=Belnapia rosea TaxID=938405 RepID=A0A1G6KIZ9_9PROT|nr:serine hydrolase domain-containing protein [Belnapia rosea]SDC30798.1 CubicO group peptidase, beta-lactamase class C family [Belnapia rosea]